MDDPRKLLFLDIDGVLNSSAFYHPDFYKTEKECQDVIDNLNNIVTVEGCGNLIIKFPSGKTTIIEIDSIRETAFIVENGWRY